MCTLRGNFDSKPIELQLSTLQASALVLFNDAKDLTYAVSPDSLCVCVPTFALLNNIYRESTRLHTFCLTFPICMCAAGDPRASAAA